MNEPSSAPDVAAEAPSQPASAPETATNAAPEPSQAQAPTAPPPTALLTPPVAVAAVVQPVTAPVPASEPRPVITQRTSGPRSHSPPPITDKGTFPGPRPLPSIHTFASVHQNLASSAAPGPYDRNRQLDQKPLSSSRIGFGGPINFPPISSLTAGRDSASPSLPSLASSTGSSSARPLLPGINQLSPPLGTSPLHSPLHAPYRNPMSVSAMLSGPPRDHTISVYASQQQGGQTAGQPTSATAPQPPTLPPYDANAARREDAKLSASGSTPGSSTASPALNAARRPEEAARTGLGSSNGSPRVTPTATSGTVTPVVGGDKDKEPLTQKLPERSSYPPLPSAFARESPYSTWPQQSTSTPGKDDSSASASPAAAPPSYGSRHMPSSTQIDPKPQSSGAPKSNFFPQMNAYRPAPTPNRFPWTALAPGGAQQQQQQQQQQAPPPQHRGEYPDYYQTAGPTNQPTDGSNRSSHNGHAHHAASHSPQLPPSQVPASSASGQRNGGTQLPRPPPSQASRSDAYLPKLKHPMGSMGTGFPDMHTSQARAPPMPASGQQQGHPSQPQGHQQLSQHSHQHPRQEASQNGFGGRRETDSPSLAPHPHAHAHAHAHAQAGPSMPASPATLKRRRSDGTLANALDGPRPAKVVRAPAPFSATQARRAEIRSPLVRVDSASVLKFIAAELLGKDKDAEPAAATAGGASKELKAVDKGKEKAVDAPATADKVAIDVAPSEERPYLGQVVYDPFVNPASLLDGDVLRNGVGGIVEVALPTSLFDGCRYEVGSPDQYEGTPVGLGDAAMDVDPDERERQQLAVPGDLFDLEALRRRKVWGTDVYTDDSDVLAICIHSGWIRLAPKPAASRAPAATPRADGVAVALEEQPKTLLVRLVVAPALVRYHGCSRQGLQSRSWGNGHDGVSLFVQAITPIPTRVQPHGRRWLKVRAGEIAARLAERDSPVVLSRPASSVSTPSDTSVAPRLRDGLGLFTLSGGFTDGAFVACGTAQVAQ